MRKRFRGNQPIATSVELEGEKGKMLYAGKGTYDDLDEQQKRMKEGDEYETFTRNDGIEDLRKKS